MMSEIAHSGYVFSMHYCNDKSYKVSSISILLLPININDARNNVRWTYESHHPIHIRIHDYMQLILQYIWYEKDIINGFWILHLVQFFYLYLYVHQGDAKDTENIHFLTSPPRFFLLYNNIAYVAISGSLILNRIRTIHIVNC